MQCISVDLPDPHGPITAVNEPAGMSTVTSSSAVTAVGPCPWSSSCHTPARDRCAAPLCVPPGALPDSVTANHAADRMQATYRKAATALRTRAEVTSERHDTEAAVPAAGALEDWLDDLTTHVTLPQSR